MGNCCAMPLSSLHMVFSRKHSFYYSFIYLKCIFGCTGLLHGLSLVEAGEDSSQAAVFKLLTAVVLLSPSTVSKCMGFSTCSTWAPGGMWNPPRPGIEPMSPALAGGFLSSGPPGNSHAKLLTMMSVISQGYPCLSENESLEV